MASFLRKISVMRNWRMHAHNTAYEPWPTLWHEITQGICTGEPVAYGTRPKSVVTAADNILAYVLARRPEWMDYPWTARSDLDAKYYVHPARRAQFRIIELMEKDLTITREQAFDVVDKEMEEMKEDVDLQVAVAREHAARIGVPNQGPAALFERAAKVYEAVHELQQENAERVRRDELKSLCEARLTYGHRLSLDDLEVMPFQDERMQFFTDYPEYRELFPPQWHTVNQVMEDRAISRAIRSRTSMEDLEAFIDAEGGDETRALLRSAVVKQKLAPPHVKHDEEAPEWPTAEMYEAAKRAKTGLEPARTKIPPTEDELRIRHERDVEHYDRTQQNKPKVSLKDLASAKNLLSTVKDYSRSTPPQDKIKITKEELQDYLGPNQLLDMLKDDLNAPEEDYVHYRKASQLDSTLQRRDHSIFKADFAFQQPDDAEKQQKIAQYAKKLAHDYEDQLPVKSKEYIEECDEFGRPIGLPYDPATVSTNTNLLTMVVPEIKPKNFVEESIYGAVDQWQTLWPADSPESCIYKGPKYIREHFPAAYKIAVKQVEEEAHKLEKRPAPDETTYKGLWRTVKAKEGKPVPKEREEVIPRSLWQRQVDLNPTSHRLKSDI
eukprot:TRINITY_DN5460_c0_g1_i1.p1 TRINITY_DN5460_c0_g1~~TRINITY_DN5460_c0_g1_i1.p1  ORF type:complete len:609 (-),score=178.45 TRINITY_DN5460_c0_g1_i1:25-1851(-)